MVFHVRHELMAHIRASPAGIFTPVPRPLKEVGFIAQRCGGQLAPPQNELPRCLSIRI